MSGKSALWCPASTLQHYQKSAIHDVLASTSPDDLTRSGVVVFGILANNAPMTVFKQLVQRQTSNMGEYG